MGPLLPPPDSKDRLPQSPDHRLIVRVRLRG